MMYRIQSAADMRQLGMRLAGQLHPGDVLVLRGELGAGKSELVRGIAKGLGIADPVPSPSFTILNAYLSGNIPLYHFDWYRLHQAEELYEMGMDEYIGGDGVAAIEWAELFPEAIPPDHLVIHITADGENARRVSFSSAGAFRTLDWEEIRQ